MLIERERKSLCVCEREGEKESESVCVREREGGVMREREGKTRRV